MHHVRIRFEFVNVMISVVVLIRSSNDVSLDRPDLQVISDEIEIVDTAVEVE